MGTETTSKKAEVHTAVHKGTESIKQSFKTVKNETRAADSEYNKRPNRSNPCMKITAWFVLLQSIETEIKLS